MKVYLKYWYPQSIYTLGILFFATFPICGQTTGEELQAAPFLVQKDSIDHRYREDQFYFGLTFNFMRDLPVGVSQSGFSGGFQAGFIRDFPLNRSRNFGFGLGLGWSINSYRSDILISENEEGNTIFQVLPRDEFDFKYSRFSTQLVEVPFELRWRTSTAEEYRFWRVYAGIRLGYLYRFQSSFKQPGKHIRLNQVDGLNRIRYGLTFTFGYNTFNFTAYYSLNSFFDGKTLDGQKVGMQTIKVGLMFYIL